jgi:NTE family protein
MICVYVPADLSRNNVSNVLSVMTQALYIQGQAISEDRVKRADFVVKPEVSGISALELWRSRECIEAGQLAAEGSWPELKTLLVDRFLRGLYAPAPNASGAGAK